MILQPIQQQRVLPAQFRQQVLPAVTVDTSQIKKQIQEMYGKTIVLPETHSVEVKNFIETPQGLVQQPSPPQGVATQIPPTQSFVPQTAPTQSFVQQPSPTLVQQPSPTLVQQQILPNQSMALPSLPNPVYSTQSLINQSYNPLLVSRTPTTFQSYAPGSMVLPTNNTQFLYNRILPNQSAYVSASYNPLTYPRSL